MKKTDNLDHETLCKTYTEDSGQKKEKPQNQESFMAFVLKGSELLNKENTDLVRELIFLDSESYYSIDDEPEIKTLKRK